MLQRGNVLVFVLCSLAFVNLAAADCEWIEIENLQIRGFIEETLNGTLAECKEACEDAEEYECKSFEYYQGLQSCGLSSKSIDDEGILTEETPGVSYFQLDECDDGLSDIVQFIEDSPELAALFGMGVLILLLFIIIVVLLCVMSPKNKDSDYVKK